MEGKIAIADDFKDRLAEFFGVLRGETTVGDFLETFERLIPRMHAAGLGDQYRLASDDLKKLRDEISPVARFVRAHANPKDRISFALNNTFPDCTLYHRNGRTRGIEVTVARGLARFNEMTEMNECGETRGFIELQDNASRTDIAAAKKRWPHAAH